MSAPGPPDDRLRRRLLLLYSEYRTAILNRKYYGHRLKNSKRWERSYDITIGVGTSGTVASWSLWQTPGGEPLWAVIGGIVALGALIKPALPLPQLVERYSKLYTGYAGLCFDIKQVIDQVDAEHALPDDLWTTFRNGQARLKDLAASDDTHPSRRLIDHYVAETNREVPAKDLWMPKKTRRSEDEP